MVSWDGGAKILKNDKYVKICNITIFSFYGSYGVTRRFLRLLAAPAALARPPEPFKGLRFRAMIVQVRIV